MRERARFDAELRDLEVEEVEAEGFFPFDLLKRLTRKDIGVEFDLNYGMEAAAPPSSAPANSIDDDEVLTTHTRATDGFKVVMDGNRMEVSTKPVAATGSGKADLDALFTNVEKFVSSLETGCGTATPQTVPKPADSLAGSRALGKPRFFQPAFAKVAGRPVFPLGLNRSEPYFRGTCPVFGSPQATIDVPLAAVDALVTAIRKSVGKAPGIALSGSSRYRAGSRSDALFHAQTTVNASRTGHFKRKTKLADGAVITPAIFTPALQGFMILLVQYLRTSEIQYGDRDYEGFAKAYVPLLTKTHFRDLFHQVLNSTDRRVFLELYGAPAVRDGLYALAGRPNGGGTRNLFPGADRLRGQSATHRARVQLKQDQFFSKRLTWHDLVQLTIDNTPLMVDVTSPVSTAVGTIGKESLFTPLASATNGPPMAGPDGARVKGVRLELRRIGFDWVPATRWRKLAEKVFDLTRTLNGVP